MKNMLLFGIILISTFSYTQSNNDIHSKDTKFVYGKKGLVPRHFSVDVEEMDVDELYSKVKDWFDERYNNGNEDDDKKGKTDKAVNDFAIYDVSEDDLAYEDEETDETEKRKKTKRLRFRAYTDNAICFGKGANYSCEGIEYLIDLRIRDEEYRFRPVKLAYKAASSKKKITISLNKHKFYSKDGKIMEGYEKVSSQIETLLNGLNKSLLNYLTGKEQEEEW